MKGIRRGWLWIISASMAINYACVREGCTDEQATNYDAKARKDDGSCIYSGGEDDQGNQEQGNHSYSLVSAAGDTLLSGEVSYSDGLAQVGMDEDNDRYRLKWVVLDDNEPGFMCGGVVYLNQNNQPEMSTISGNENDGNGIEIQTVGLNGVMYATYEGTLSLEDFQLRNQLSTGDKRVTSTIVFDGVFVDLAEEYLSAKLTITFNN